MRALTKSEVATVSVLVGWLAAIAFMSWILSGCQPQERPSTFDMLTQAETVVTSGTETLLEAVRLGRVDISSQSYAEVYEGLEKANRVLDGAWAAYRAGDMEGAETARRVALSVYNSIRPILLELAEGG